MVTATAGVKGLMAKEAKDKAAKLDESRGRKAAKPGSTFLEDNPTLRNTLAQIEKEFGEGSIMPLGVDAQVEPVLSSEPTTSVSRSDGREGR